MDAHPRAARRDGATVLLTTHYLDEADALWDRIMIIDHGKIVASGTPDELKRRISGDIVTFELDDAANARPSAARARGPKCATSVPVEAACA